MTDDQLHGDRDANAALIEVLIANGDLPHVPREVEHVAIFRRKSDAAAAAAALETLGFRVQPPRRRLLAVLLEFTRTDAVDLATANRCTEEIYPIAARYGGEYDGWSCAVQTTEPADGAR